MSATVENETRDVEARRDVLTERLFGAMLAGFDLLTVYLGDRLGYYRALAEEGPATSAQLAARTGTAERYAREWLEQQAVTGILSVENPDDDAEARRFAFPAGHDGVLVDPDSLNYLIPAIRTLVAIGQVLPAIEEAYRTGGGVPFEAFGQDLREGQAGMNRPQFARLLATEWLPAMPDVHARLQVGVPARVADIGMGAGWSSIAFARTYPTVVVDGYDLDVPSVELARANAAEAGVDDRVRFHVHDASDPALAGTYDLACAFECIHDMSQPVAALASMRRLVGDGGTVLVMDERVADRFEAPGDDVERFMYGYSVLHCLPAGMAEQPSLATGTVMRKDVFRRYAAEAGYRDVEVLPIEHDTFVFYRLTG
jgi:SAM-dependent methyltransferase